LQRVNSGAFGNDPANWVGATLTPAAARPAGNAPLITSQPQNRAVAVSSNVTLSVTATGDAPLRYQWLFEGDSLPGKTNSTLLLPNVTPAQQGAYQVLVLNNAGSVASSNAILTVVTRAKITQQPQDTQAHLGSTAIFVVQTTGSTPLSYQWRKGGLALSNRTNSFLSIANIQGSDAGLYDVMVADVIGSITSVVARLTVLANPVITSQPVDLNVTVVAPPVNVTNSVTASSGTPLRYQWYFNGGVLVPTANIPNVTNASLVIGNVQLSHAGDYFVIVSDNFGSVTSRTAKLTVNTRLQYTVYPLSQTVPEGSTVGFSAGWAGSGPFLHRWRRTQPTPITTLGVLNPTSGLGRLFITNGYIIASATNSVLVFTNVGTNLAGSYDIVVSNVVAQSNSTAAALTVIADADRDGLPDSWETGRPNFNVNDPSDARRDDDGDHMSNADEYLAGTDYLNPDSCLRAALQVTGPVQLTFEAISNRPYMVQFNESLNLLSWSNLVIEPARSNSSRAVTVTDPSPRPRRYYRLATPAQP